MKRLFSFLLFILICNPIHLSSQVNVSDEYINTLSRSYVNVPNKSDDSSVFWDFIKNNSVDYNAYLNDRRKLKYKMSLKFQKDVDQYAVITQHLEDSNKILWSLFGENYSFFANNFFIIEDDDISAFATPNGGIYVSTGLLGFCDDSVELIGVIAHEIAHIILEHARIANYESKKDARRKNWNAALASLAYGTVTMGAQIIAANSGVYTNYDEEQVNSQIAFYNNLNKLTEINKLRSKYSYSREQEFEADYVACLYLKWAGLPPLSYIHFLYRLCYNNLYMEEGSGTHPTSEFRASMLYKLFVSRDIE